MAGSDDNHVAHKSSKHDKKKRKHSSAPSDKQKRAKHSKRTAEPHAGSATAAPSQISADDYFQKAREFQLWLSEARRVFIDELPSEEARRLFGKFCRRWNAGELPSKYYEGIQQVESINRTRHQWGFASKLSDADQLALDRTKDSVASQTQAKRPK